MTRTILVGATPNFATRLKIDLSVLGASHVLPAGGATAAALISTRLTSLVHHPSRLRRVAFLAAGN